MAPYDTLYVTLALGSLTNVLHYLIYDYLSQLGVALHTHPLVRLFHLLANFSSQQESCKAYNMNCFNTKPLFTLPGDFFTG